MSCPKHVLSNLMVNLPRFFSSFLVIFGVALPPLAGYCKETNTNSQDLARKAVARIEDGDYETGITLLKNAIQKNEGDIGQLYSPGILIDIQDFLWGEKQLLKMLADRPIMRSEIEEGDELWVWACTKFAGFGTTKRIKWDPTPPSFNAEYVPHTKNSHGLVRVSFKDLVGPQKGRQLTFEEAWQAAIFELHNIDRSEPYVRLCEFARHGQISRAEFIKSAIALEYMANQETRAFYVKVALPWMARKQLQTNPRLWYTSSVFWGTFDAFFKESQGYLAYHLEFYGRFYDSCSNYYLNQLEFNRGKVITLSDIKAIRNYCVYDHRAINALLSALDSSDPQVSKEAEQLLNNPGLVTNLLENELIPGLESETDEVFIDVLSKIRLLGKLASSAIPVLTDKLKVTDNLCVIEILETLHALGATPDELLPGLLELLNSEHSVVR